jgi:hypothetical protein
VLRVKANLEAALQVLPGAPNPSLTVIDDFF